MKLGCVLPGEPSAVYGDALRRMATDATYLYEDNVRYWYATQPTVTDRSVPGANQSARSAGSVAPGRPHRSGSRAARESRR